MQYKYTVDQYIYVYVYCDSIFLFLQIFLINEAIDIKKQIISFKFGSIGVANVECMTNTTNITCYKYIC